MNETIKTTTSGEFETVYDYSILLVTIGSVPISFIVLFIVFACICYAYYY